MVRRGGNRVEVGRHLWSRAALGLAYALLLTGCASAHAVRLPKAGAELACITPAAPQDTVVGVSLSGGGSRAALPGPPVWRHWVVCAPPRLGNYAQVREAIELELESILDGKKKVKEGLDAAVTKGNAILRQFGITHGAAGQGEI